MTAAVDPEALAARLAMFRTPGIGLAHELANPLHVILTNARMIADDVAALRGRTGADLHADLDALAAATADIVAMGERLEALAAALLALPSVA